MKNYSSNRAQKGKTAYRTPSRLRVKKTLYSKLDTAHLNTPSFQRRSRQRP